MLNNYLKLAWRNITRNKTYTGINVLSLTFGITACIVVYTIVNYDLSFDTFHPDKERVYRVTSHSFLNDGQPFTFPFLAPFVPGSIANEISGIEKVCGIFPYEAEISIPDSDHPEIRFSNNADGGNVTTIVTGSDYFDIFQYNWLAGNPTAFREPFKVILTAGRARQYFGSESFSSMLGNEIAYNDSLRLTVVGIVEDWMGNTDFRFTDLISMPTIETGFLESGISPMVFVKLGKSTLPESVDRQFKQFVSQHFDPNEKLTYRLQPLTEIHFTEDENHGDGAYHFDGDKFRKAHLPTLYKLAGAALFVLFLAVINFINLFSAQSTRRAKEMGIRKSVGGVRANLTIQILCETFMQTLIAVAFSVLLIRPTLSVLERSIPDGADFQFLDLRTLSFLLLLILITSILAGIYPARILSGHSPALSLRGIVGPTGKRGHTRKVMVVFQFVISLIFVTAAIVVSDQLRFIKEESRLTTSPILNLKVDDKAKVFADKIRQAEGVVSAAVQGIPPAGLSRIMTGVQNKNLTAPITDVSIKNGDEYFIELYEMKLLAGRNLVASDSIREFVINSTYSKVLGMRQPDEAIGELIYFHGKPYTVVGVVEDFHEGSLHEAISPIAIGYFPRWQNKLAIKLASGAGQDISSILSRIESQWKVVFPDTPFNYSFFEDEVKVLYQKEENVTSLVNGLMLIAIFISGMGVFGLAMFNAETRTKEVGIRKILGAKITTIVILFSKEFMALVLLAMVIASPIAWYLTNEWLSNFIYRVDVEWSIFLYAGLIALATAIVASSSQALKAALANPIKSLRSE